MPVEIKDNKIILTKSAEINSLENVKKLMNYVTPYDYIEFRSYSMEDNKEQEPLVQLCYLLQSYGILKSDPDAWNQRFDIKDKESFKKLQNL